METRAIYGGAEIRPQTLRPFANDWAQPTPDEVREVLRRAGLSGSATAKLLGIQSGRTIRRWTSDHDQVPIPYAAWAILCYQAGLGAIWEAKGIDVAG